MTSTIIESDVDTIEHLDFEEAVPCETNWCAPNEAEVIVEKTCCGKIYLICENCFFENKRRERLYAESRIDWKCDSCGQTHCAAVGFLKFVRWLDRGR